MKKYTVKHLDNYGSGALDDLLAVEKLEEMTKGTSKPRTGPSPRKCVKALQI